MREEEQPKRRRLSPEARQAQIIEAARAAFCETGFQGTNVGDVAKRAGITEPYFYRHFKSREQIFELAILDPLDRIIEQVTHDTREVANRRDLDRAAALKEFHELMLNHVLEMVPLIAATLFSDPLEGPKFYGEILIPRMRDNIRSVLAKFTGWHGDSDGVAVAAQALMGVHLGIALESVLSKQKLNVAYVAEQLTLIFAPGLSGQPNAKPAAKVAAKAEKGRTAAAKAAPVALFWGEVDETAAAPAAAAHGRKRLTEAERRETISQAARDVFLQFGLSGARSKAIAQRAGITEAFMFRHFASKEQMYEEAVERPLEQAFATLARRVQALGKSTSGIGFIEQLNRLNLSFFVKYARLCSVALFSELSEGQRYYRKMLTPHLEAIGQVIVTRAGWNDPKIDPEIIRKAMTGAQWALGFDYNLRHRSQEVDEIALNLTRLFTGGVRRA